MAYVTKARVFMSGRSQAVRIPAQFRLDSQEVYIYRDSRGDIVLSDHPEKPSLKEVYAMLDAVGVPDDLLAEQDSRVAEEREIL